MPLEAIKYDEGSALLVLDQLQLPHVQIFDEVRTAEDGWHSIKAMRVRGAPAIAVVAALSLAVELADLQAAHKLSSVAEEVELFIIEKLDYLVTSRPTAVNLSDAAHKLKKGVEAAARTNGASGNTVAAEYKKLAKNMLQDDIKDNRNIGKHGADWIVEQCVRQKQGLDKVSILTHCNTGSLATAGHGTALGIIRSLKEQSALQHAYCTETRPYNQGSRLTAYELVHDNIPATLITDSMAAALLAKKEANVAAIVVGADRVAANGDTANKIGTYGLAVLARHHGVKFLVAAPLTTIDRATKSGEDIVIEERPKSEVTTIRGPRCVGGRVEPEHVETISIAAQGIDVWNPAFDVTPAALIDGVVTDRGVVEKGADGVFNFEAVFEESQT